MTGINTQYIQGYAQSIIGIINGLLVPVLLALAFIVFLWGVYKFFVYDSDKAKKEGRDFVMYGLIGFVVIFSVWGIVLLLMSSLSLAPGTTAPPYPTLNGSTGNGGATGGSANPRWVCPITGEDYSTANECGQNCSGVVGNCLYVPNY